MIQGRIALKVTSNDDADIATAGTLLVLGATLDLVHLWASRPRETMIGFTRDGVVLGGRF